MVKEMFAESFSILGRSYRLTMRWKRLWKWNFLILGIMILISKFYELHMPAGITPLRLIVSPLVALVSSVLGLGLFFYVVGLSNNEQDWFFTHLKKGVFCLVKPFFIVLILIACINYLFKGSPIENFLVALVSLVALFSPPVIALGSGSIKQGLLDLFHLWRRFWLSAVVFLGILFFVAIVAMIAFGLFLNVFFAITFKVLEISKFIDPVKLKDYIGVVSPASVSYITVSIGFLVWYFALVQMYEKIKKIKS